ncbi:hypothetical protein JCM11491_003632 [Sporobolomyces phaffii]
MHRIFRSVRPTVRQASKQSTKANHARQSFFWSSASSTSAAAGAGVDLAATSIPHCGPDVLPYLFGIVLANAVAGLDDEDVDKLHSPPWKVASMSAKGYGAVADKDLDLGDLLIAERPLCIWPSKLDQRQAKELFDQMDEREQRAYMDLAPVVAKDANLDDIRSRRAANGFSIALPAVPGYSGTQTVSMIFPKISRINHSCLPNASQVMNFETLRMEVFSITKVPSGSEVTIEYSPGMITKTKQEREATLYEAFGFDKCLCQLCSSSSAEVARSDARRREIKQLSETLEGVRDRQATLAKLERIRILLEEEGFKGPPAFGIRGTRLSPIQQAALLQSLLTQRHSRANGTLHPTPRVTESASTSRLPPLESIVASLPPPAAPFTTSFDDDGNQMPFSRIEGLNELQAPALTASSSFGQQLAPNHLDELLNAQTNLDIWASTVFQAGSPGFVTPPADPDPSPSLRTSNSSSSTGHHQLSGMVAAPTPFDWSTLYPHAQGGPAGTPPPLHHALPNGLPDFGFPQSHFSAFSSIPPLDTTLRPLSRGASFDESSSRAPSPRPSRPSRSRRASKAPPSRPPSEGGQGSDTPSLAAREFMTPEEIEDDKRRRNTEASARFRAKKKQRNVALQETAAELRDKVAALEKEKDALTSQNRWLRDIISEKASVHSTVTDALPRP